MTTEQRLATLVLVLTVAVGFVTFDGLIVRNEIADFVPNTEERELAEIAREVTDSELSRTIVLNLGPGEASDVAAAAGEMKPCSIERPASRGRGAVPRRAWNKPSTGSTSRVATRSSRTRLRVRAPR